MVAQIEKRKPDAQNMKKRRFLMLQKLKEEGKYFSEEKMREREPYLYDVMVGKFTDAKDQLNLRPSVSREECPEGGWASMLCQFESSREIAQRRNEHHTEWHRDSGDAEMLEDGMDDSPEILRREFQLYMEERFLAGHDSRFFDYDAVDNDVSLDEVDEIHERDMEEKWFDADDE
ncbi:hypothetical protein OSTOST_11149 [Ostertagia ostertagi]